MKSVSLVSLKDQAAAALRREIYAGELPDGAELRQEDIAAQLGISRLPVREAMQQLQNEGLLERPPCAGGGGDRRASAAELCRAGGYGVRVVRAGRHRPAGKGAARPGVRCGVPFGSRRGAGQSNAVSALFHPAARIVGRRAGAGGG